MLCLTHPLNSSDSINLMSIDRDDEEAIFSKLYQMEIVLALSITGTFGLCTDPAGASVQLYPMKRRRDSLQVGL